VVEYWSIGVMWLTMAEQPMTIAPSLRYSATPGRLITVSLITDY